jgi:hypothetical protein
MASGVDPDLEMDLPGFNGLLYGARGNRTGCCVVISGCPLTSTSPSRRQPFPPPEHLSEAAPAEWFRVIKHMRSLEHADGARPPRPGLRFVSDTAASAEKLALEFSDSALAFTVNGA